MANPNVFYMCPFVDRPCGGVQVIHRHVDLLRKHNVDAWVWTPNRPWSKNWHNVVAPFAHDAKQSDDWSIFVVPENSVDDIPYRLRGRRVVIFNQNPYYTFGKYPPGAMGTPCYDAPNVERVLTVSPSAVEYLKFAFPTVVDKFKAITLGLDPKLYYPGVKKPIVAYMSRKNQSTVEQVLGMLRSRHSFDGTNFTLQHIDNLTQVETAAVLRESAIFMNFGDPEGFGLCLYEALACGCCVVGYDGRVMMGQPRPHGPAYHHVPVGCVLRFVQGVEEFTHEQLDGLEIIGKRYGACHAAQYTPANELTTLREAWAGIIDF